MRAKLPVSVLVVIHTAALDVLLLERASRPGYWQSVTGSLDRLDEPLQDAARRELREETGIDADGPALVPWHLANAFEIYAHWRRRFAPGTTHNTEHVFGLMLPQRIAVTLAAQEHRAQQWLPWREAAEKCFSWSNRDAIRMLPARSAAA
ncbi:MAG TPA: dihydroneopterin triphosphate diphosphatase [Burkholderiales bacterium]|nr:dihydroneopterin triphosphate diphosphatase [Burkholderiales bacterium]